MTPAEIPAELIAILDRAAGREHSRTGSVAACLAEILGRYDQLKAEAWHNAAQDRIGRHHLQPSCWRCCIACEPLNPYFDDARNSLRDTAASGQNLDEAPDVEVEACPHLKPPEGAGLPADQET